MTFWIVAELLQLLLTGGKTTTLHNSQLDRVTFLRSHANVNLDYYVQLDTYSALCTTSGEPVKQLHWYGKKFIPKRSAVQSTMSLVFHLCSLRSDLQQARRNEEEGAGQMVTVKCKRSKIWTVETTEQAVLVFIPSMCSKQEKSIASHKRPQQSKQFRLH